MTLDAKQRTEDMAQFHLPTRVITGVGCFAQLGAVVRENGHRALLVCGPSALRRSGALRRGLDNLREVGVHTTVYDDVVHEPTLEMVQEALDAAHQAHAEVVIGVGGGSAMDVGKAAALLFTQPGTVQEYHHGRPVKSQGLPFVSVPTTAGTGTEVTNNAVLTDPVRGVKQSIRGPHLFATAAIVDPELTLSLPPAVTAGSGADALCQAIESFVSSRAQPLTDALTRQAIQWIGRSLVRAYEHGSDVGARADMLYGSLFAGMSMTHTRLGGAHALAHPLGYHYHIPHGVVCGLLLPYVMEYTLEFVPDKYAQIAQLLQLNVQGLGPREAARLAVDAVRSITGRVGIPDRLHVFGLTPERLGSIIAEALPSGNLKSNPKALGADDLQVILERAL